MIAVYDEMGGDEAFHAWASKEKNKQAFYSMVTKVIPKNLVLSSDADAPAVFTLNVIKANDTTKD